MISCINYTFSISDNRILSARLESNISINEQIIEQKKMIKLNIKKIKPKRSNETKRKKILNKQNIIETAPKACISRINRTRFRR